jgi:hypothetical protein
VDESNVISLAALESQARAAIEKKNSKAKEKVVSEPETLLQPVESAPEQPVTTEIVPVEELPIVEVSKGGGHLKKQDSDELSKKDLEVLSMLACGIEKTVAANIAGIDRSTVHRLLNTERVERLTKGAKKRLAALAPLAVEIIHSELVKGNVEVAQQVLKGLAIMKTSVNGGASNVKERSCAEEIIENDGKVTRRVTKETND